MVSFAVVLCIVPALLCATSACPSNSTEWEWQQAVFSPVYDSVRKHYEDSQSLIRRINAFLRYYRGALCDERFESIVVPEVIGHNQRAWSEIVAAFSLRTNDGEEWALMSNRYHTRTIVWYRAERELPNPLELQRPTSFLSAGKPIGDYVPGRKDYNNRDAGGASSANGASSVSSSLDPHPLAMGASAAMLYELYA
jgi:hypothetical protein